MKQVIANMLRKEYVFHRKRVRNAKCYVDAKPPRVPKKDYISEARMVQDILANRAIMNKNTNIVKRIMCIERKRGRNSNKTYVLKDTQKYNEERVEFRLRNIEKENRKLGCIILKAKPYVQTGLNSKQRKSKKPTPNQYQVPQLVYNAYKEIVSARSQPSLNKLLRPKIYFEVATMDSLAATSLTPLGRVKIQLFTEACPEVVLEFVRIFAKREPNCIHFIRIFTSLWLEGELLLPDNKTVHNSNKLIYNANVINHRQNEGVLAFSKEIYTLQKGLLNFSISFRGVSVAKSEHIAIGLVTYGMATLLALQPLGTRHGNVKKKIVVVKCGTE